MYDVFKKIALSWGLSLMRVSTERCTAWTSARNWATYHLQQEQYCPDVALSIMPD